MYVLGLWDGHDAGAALLEDGNIVYAANEERFTKRKLEMKFPYNSIRAALDYAQIKPTDIENITYTTTEFTKTLERIYPGMKERYYLFRRRKIPKPRFEGFMHNLKYSMTGVGILPLCNTVSSSIISKQLRHMGFKNFKLRVVEHHTAHAATAAFTSGFKKSLVITLDGLGDGLSGSVSTFDNGKLERHISIPARDSLGIFFEQITNIIGMRELEDEGKVMAMADYSYPFDFDSNKLKDMFRVEGTIISAKYNARKQFAKLQSIGWQMPREQFSYMAQQLLENIVVKFVSNVVDRFSIGDVVLAGGLFSNIKANMKIRKLENVKHWYVFPHMGDGGIALGSALYTDYELNGSTSHDFSAYLGNDYDAETTMQALKKDRSLETAKESHAEQARHAAELISNGNYVFWFQGRMEYGPRALGDRSILAPPDSESVKEKLNLYVKRREWFQPFAPSMLEEDLARVVDYDNKGYDRYMTMAYSVKDSARDATKSVVNVDYSARPQAVGQENPNYRELLDNMRKLTGYGLVLNTSFNLHGMPIVMTPEDAIATMKATKTKYMFINGVTVTNKRGV
ncbi:MAG: carbamoyltransferase C-terminal domain-containing protein [Methanothrix sp.]|jgi:carbamoyltransferase